MADLHDRFRSLDRIAVPDVWNEIEQLADIPAAAVRPVVARARWQGARSPWRAIAVVALLIVALAVGMILVLSQPRRELPAPYGPAGNGLVVYAWSGIDIYLGNPVTGATRPLVTGPEVDTFPFFSRDGSTILFLRADTTDPVYSGYEMIANADGSQLRQLNDVPLTEIVGGDWSGDGRSLIIISVIDGLQTMTMFDVESGAHRTLAVGMAVDWMVFRPPDGSELLFVGGPFGDQSLYTMHADGSNLRRVAGPAASIGEPEWSPDGTQIAYSGQEVPDGDVVTHIVGADGIGDVALDNPSGVNFQVSPKWSPDGRFLLIGRGYQGWTGHGQRLALIALDGAVAGREFEPSEWTVGVRWEWSPDGTKIVIQNPNGFSVIDVATGEEVTKTGWFWGNWQRVETAP